MTKRQRQLKPDPLNIPDPLALFPDPLRRRSGGESLSSVSGMTFNASIAASVSAQDATGDGVTVMPHVPRQPTDNGNASASASSVDLATTKPNTTLTRCEHCGREFVARRPWARYCNAYCRRRAWL
jgi:hypothetical protein